MKKLLSVLLTAAIALTLVAAGIPALTVSAISPVSVTFFDCDSTAGFGFNIAPAVDTTEKVQGTASIRITYGDTIFQRGFEEAIDASRCDTLEFDVFIEDLDALTAMDGSGQIEIGSGKANDVEELGWDPINTLTGQVKEAGWNHIVLPFATGGVTGGAIDTSRIDWFRWYWVGASNRLEICMDNFVFTNQLAYAQAAKALEDEAKGVGTLFNGCNSAEGFNGVTVSEETGFFKTGTGSWKFSLGAQMIESTGMTAADLSAYNRIEFDLYVTDADAVKELNGNSEFEISSSGKCDDKELHWLSETFTKDLQDGWNHVVLEFAEGSETNGPIDMSAVNYLRWYWVGNDSGVDAYIDNIRLLEASDETLLTEEYTFVVFEDSETQYLYNSNAGKTAEKRFSDRNTETVYLFTIDHSHAVRKITITGKFGAQLLLQAGTDGTNYSEVYRWESNEINESTDGSKYNRGLDGGVYTFDLTNFVELSKNVDTLYVRIADSYPTVNGTPNGWGGNIYTGEPVRLVVTYADIPSPEDIPGEDETDAESDAQPSETEAGSQGPAETSPETKAEKKGGCGSVLGLGTACLSVAGILGAALVIRKKD